MGHCKNIFLLIISVPLVLSLGFTPIFSDFGLLQEGQAVKAQGVYTKKFGSATAGIVCGVKLCSEIPNFDKSKRTSNYPSSPLLQYHFGVSIDRIICNDGYQVVLKSTNSYPACVKQQSVERLIQIGWASDEITQQTITLVEYIKDSGASDEITQQTITLMEYIKDSGASDSQT